MRSLRDPAPSRMSYRLNRLMLTPGFRIFLRFGLPLLAVGLGIAIWASDDVRQEEFAESLNDFRRQVEERPEFLVHMMVIEGATPEVEAEIRRNVPVDFPCLPLILNWMVPIKRKGMVTDMTWKAKSCMTKMVFH